MIDGAASTVHTAKRVAAASACSCCCSIFLAFARLVWGLDAQALWLDEAFSLQRAESSWPALIAGALPLTDGVRTVDTTDQHPFAYFVFLGLMLRAAGISEFALRFPAVIAATLLVPVAWALSRRLARSGSLPRSAPVWVALLVAVNPFYLWFGQEVRMYAQVALLALLSTYLLLRWADATDRVQKRIALAGYAVVVFLLLTTHYFTVMILPVQALVAFQTLGWRRPRRTLAVIAIFLVLALIPVGMALSLFARDPAAGTNWARISPRILAADLLNAFSMGLNVDIRQVWAIDLFYGAMALLGAIYGLRRPDAGRPWRGWVLPALVLLPPAALLVISAFRPAYMTARHMSMISGFFLVLVGGGVAWLWDTRRWAGGLVAVVLLAGAAYSTADYHLAPRHGGGDLAGMGDYLRERDSAGRPPPNETDTMGAPIPVLSAGRHGERRRRHQPTVGLARAIAVERVERRRSRSCSNCGRTIAEFGWSGRGGRTRTTSGFLRTRFGRSTRHSRAPGPRSMWTCCSRNRRCWRSRPQRSSIAWMPSSADKCGCSGYDLGQPLVPGGAIPVTLYWQPAGQIGPSLQIHPALGRLRWRDPLDDRARTVQWRRADHSLACRIDNHGIYRGSPARAPAAGQNASGPSDVRR